MFNLVIETTPGGTTDPPLGTYSYSSGHTVDVKIITENGYVFHHWELDTVNVGSGSPYSVLMETDRTLKAVSTPVPVGGEWVPLGKSFFLAPLLEWVSLVIVMTTSIVCARRRRRQMD